MREQSLSKGLNFFSQPEQTMKNIIMIALASAGMVYGQKQVTIFDSILNMNAFAGTIPANWSFEGTVLQPTACNISPTPVYRAASPDGVTEARFWPVMGWSWVQGSPPFQ